MMAATEFVKDCVAVPFAKPVPTRELTLLRNPLRAESNAAAAFREEAAAVFDVQLPVARALPSRI
jgi:hypothetical protein